MAASPLLTLLLLLCFLPLLALFFLLRLLCRPRPSVVPIKNRHVLVTGGSSGIGLEIAKLALEEGASAVSIMARDLSRLSEAQRSIQKSTGKQVRIFSADVRDFESVEKAVSEIGRVDVLICSHGVSIPKAFVDCSVKEMNDMLDINLRGNLNVVKAILPSMKSRSDSSFASIAIVSSQAGQTGLYGFVPYSASKFGLKGMAEALQQEVICDNIIVSLIYPPDTHTPGFEKENETKPLITKLLSGSNAVEAVDVAKRAINGIKAGKFSIPCNFDGWMLSVETVGMSPQSSAFGALVEILLIGFLRFVSICFTWNWYRIISSQYDNEKKAK